MVETLIMFRFNTEGINIAQIKEEFLDLFGVPLELGKDGAPAKLKKFMSLSSLVVGHETPTGIVYRIRDW